MPRSLLFLTLPLFLLAMGTAFAQRPPAVVPKDPDRVLERLPRGYAGLMPSARTSKDQVASDLRTADIGALLNTAAQTGDTRLAARAEAILSRIPVANHSPAVLRLRAFNAQHKHDFSGALRWLDLLVDAEPRDGDARLSRAQVLMVQGRLALARRDCTALALGVDAGRGLLCIAALSTRKGDYEGAGTLLDRWLDQAADDSPSRRFALVMRAEAASLAGDIGAADKRFKQALLLSPNDARTLAAYARHLRRAGRGEEIEALLDGQLQSDTLQLLRALAAHDIGRANAGALNEAQARRYALAHAVGTQPEMRDEAEFLLSLRDDPEAALVLAQRNFQEQRDYEDVDILVRAANAADQPEALKALRDWARSQDLPLPESAQIAQ